MKALVFGSAMIDTVVIVPNDSIERMTMHNATSSFLLVEQGRKVEAEVIEVFTGGGGVNVSVSLKRQGWDVAPVMMIGEDLNGRKVRERLEAQKIDQAHVLVADGESTGTAVLIASHDRNASIFTHRGANTRLTCRELERISFDGCGLAYLAGLSNQSADCFPDIVAKAKTAGAFVFTNPGIRQLTSRQSQFFDSLASIDCLSLNRVEAASLVPRLISHPHGVSQTPVSNFDHDDGVFELGGFQLGFDAFFKDILETGPAYCLVTDGSKGAYLASKEGIVFCPALRVDPQGTAGAGDAYGSTVASWLAQGRPPHEALQAASCNAASVVRAVDTQSTLLDKAALHARVHKESALLTCTSWSWF